jgi:CubicO group peptidase (beta-lactamase class C family)
MTEIHGECDPRFEAVRTTLRTHFDEGEELGASVAVTLRGEPVVDLWAGDADESGRPWERDTLVNVWSVTKTMAATCVLLLADRGALDVDVPIATYWPEFAAHGKERVTMAQVLGHTAGLPGWDPPLTADVLSDWNRSTAALAAQAPWWKPGTASGYHAVSQGYLIGEVVRRITGRTIGTYFREEVAEPLGADFHIGLPQSEDARVAQTIPPREEFVPPPVDPSSVLGRAMVSCPLTGDEPNARWWRAAEIPAAGGTGNARSIARVHAALANGGTVDGVRLLSPEGVERIFVEQSHDVDQVLDFKVRFGMGFALMSEALPLSPNPRACFWGGWGGAFAVLDLDAQLSVAYATNRMSEGIVGDLRGALLVLAAYECL